MVVCPISPATSDAPWNSLPSMISPPPMPVPMVRPTTWRAAARRAQPPFAHRGAVGVVVERGREADALRDAVAQRKVAPPEVGRDDHEPLLAVERTGRAHADAREMRRASPPSGSSCRRSSPRSGPRCGPPRLRRPAFTSVGTERTPYVRDPSVVHRADHDVGAAEVDADDEFLRRSCGHVGWVMIVRRWRTRARHVTGREFAHALPMAERALAAARACRTAGTPVPRAPQLLNAVPAARTRTPARSGRTRSRVGVPMAERQVLRRRIVGHEHRASADQFRRAEQRQRAPWRPRAPGPAAATNLGGQRAVVRRCPAPPRALPGASSRASSP